MPNQQLIDYITQSIAQGASKEEIKSALLGAGWQEADVNEGLLAVFPVSAQKSAVGGKSKALIITVSVLATLLLAGGGFAYWYFMKEPAVEQRVVQDKELQEKQVVQEAPKEETIQDILAKAKNIGSVQYEITTASIPKRGDDAMKVMVWEKGSYVRLEYSILDGGQEELQAIGIAYPDALYFHTNEMNSNVFEKITSVQEIKDLRAMLLFGSVSEVLTMNIEVKDLGIEEFNGRQAHKIEYEIPNPVYSPENEMLWVEVTKTIVKTVWFWEEKGVPLRVEMNFNGKEKITWDYKNFIFEEISDSVFEVSQDKVIKSSQ